MSAAPLPRVIEPLKLVEQRATLSGDIDLKQLVRLNELATASEGVARVELVFGKDNEGIPVLTGKLEAGVVMQCQRCLEPVPVIVDSELKFGIVKNDRAAVLLPRYYDPLLLEDFELDLWDLVEEELILNLPIVASHSNGLCSIDAQYRTNPDAEKTSPFAALEKLKDSKL
jgi:uncharacterized protein